MNITKIQIFTDGACSGNPGRGGFGIIWRIFYADDSVKESEYSRGYVETTNNRMELLGVITALSKLSEIAGQDVNCPIEIYSDSQYVIKAFNKGWLKNWVANNWIKSNKEPVLNVGLWGSLEFQTRDKDITWIWVKGHDGNPDNERCDQLAVAAAKSDDLWMDLTRKEKVQSPPSSVDLSSISTRNLTLELQQREGVDWTYIDPYDVKKLNIEGVATVLVVFD